MSVRLSAHRRIHVGALVAVLVGAVTLAAFRLQAAPAQLTDPRLELPHLQAPGEWFDSQRAIDTVSPVDYAGAVSEASSVAAHTRAVAPEVADLEWQLLGPTAFGGRVVDLAVVPGKPNELFIAAASGGVWHSADTGVTFQRSWPDDLTQAMGALAAGSDGTLYAGTGEANPGGGSIVYGGTGLYRSTDNGATWELSGLENSGAFGRIAVDPTNPDIVYAAASGNLFVPGGERGLYRSTNGGEPGSWERILAPENNTTGAVDIAIDPSDTDRILVGMWDHHRTPEGRFYAGEGSAVWLTEDGGATWDELEEVVLQADPNPDDEYDIQDEMGRIGVAFAPSDPTRAYAIIANTLDGTHGDWFVSNDGGKSFQVAAASGLAANNSSYGWWFARIFVDPLLADHLFVAGLELIESLDGGATFLPQSNTTAGVVSGTFQGNVHSDQHAMVWSPDVPGLVYLGNDGGVYRSLANGIPGSWVGGLQQGWTQHYSVDVDEQTAEYIVTGLQDNLCQHHVGGTSATSAGWTKYGLCGDGIVTRVDPSDPTITYYCSQYGGCGRAQAGAPLLVNGLNMPNDRYGWLADIAIDRDEPATIFTAGASLWRSTNRGTAFTRMSGDLSSEPEQLDPNPGYRLRGVVTTIGLHPNDKTVWVGTDEGRLWVNHDIDSAANDLDNETWTLLDDGDETTEIGEELELPERAWISSVHPDPNDETGNTAYVAYSGFRGGDLTARLFKTTDGGQSFAAVDQGLPRAPINDVITIGSDLWVATDVGVFLLSEDGWLRAGNLPTVPVIELRYHEGTQTLTAATFGHGIQRVSLAESASPVAPDFENPIPVLLGSALTSP